jgi:hypothetical protein
MCSAAAIPAARARRRTSRQAAVRSRRQDRGGDEQRAGRALAEVGLERSHDGRGEGSGGSFAALALEAEHAMAVIVAEVLDVG